MNGRADAADAIVAQAKAAAAGYAGAQTTWKGPTSGPKPAAGKKIVYLSGDEQNGISHEYGVYIRQGAAKIGWSDTVIDGKGSPTSRLAGMGQPIALKPNGIVIFADAKSLQPAIIRGLAEGVEFVGIHAAGLPRPQPGLAVYATRRRAGSRRKPRRRESVARARPASLSNRALAARHRVLDNR